MLKLITNLKPFPPPFSFDILAPLPEILFGKVTTPPPPADSR